MVAEKRGRNKKMKYLFFSFIKFYLCEKHCFMKRVLLLLLVGVLFVSCGNRAINVSAELLPVGSAPSAEMALAMRQLIAPYKVDLDAKMNVEVGFCAMPMDVGRPESLLSNFVCDAMLKKANEYMPTDFALTNIGGLRKPIAQGVVTLRTVYEVMPFDNQVVLLDLSGQDVLALCNAIASVGGEGVSGITFGISGGKASDVKIGGKPLDVSRVYRVATTDYLSFGNDKMLPLLNRLQVYDLSLPLRDLILEAISGVQQMESNLDGRINEK